MTRLCYDSTRAADLPPNAEIVAGYIDGIYKWSEADWALFPNAVKVRIAVFAFTNDGHVGDVEDGCMTPSGAAEWVRMRRAAGVDPTLYVNLSNWQATRDACAAIGEPEPHWWVASYDNVAVIPPGAVAKQYANEPLTGGHYDASIVEDIWQGVDDMDDAEFKRRFLAVYAEIGVGALFDAMKVIEANLSAQLASLAATSKEHDDFIAKVKAL